MPVYFFHERVGDAFHLDEQGIDCLDIETVRREAVAGAREIIAAAILNGRIPLRHCFEIADDQGRLVLTLPFSSTVEIDR